MHIASFGSSDCKAVNEAVSRFQHAVQNVQQTGVTQTVHVCVTTYGESAEMVRECLIRLLAAPEPLDMEKYLYVCDDGHAKPEGPKKRAVVEELRTLGALLCGDGLAPSLL
jgi:hypothetical protein